MKKRMFKKPLRASSTLQDNLDDELLVEENDTVLLNHQNFGDILVDPDDMPEDLHKPLLAGLRKKSQKKVKAAAEDVLIDDDEDLTLLDDMPEDGLIDKEDILAEDETFFDDSDLDGVSPSDLIVSGDEGTVLDEDTTPDVSCDTSAAVKSATRILSLSETDTMPSDVKPQETVDTEQALEETAPEENLETKQREGEGDGDAVKVESKKKAKKVKAEDKDEDTVLDNNQKPGQLTVESSVDYNLVDLDGVKDSAEDVMFAAVGNTKWAIRANRIIAELTEESAKQLSAEDIYLDDEYDEATLAEVKSKGLRAGLRSMGYKLTTVNIKSSAQVKANVARLTASAKAEMKAKVEARDKVMQDSLVLAAVGLNRNIFKDYENTLRNELVASLQNAGVRNASRIVRAAFEKYGTDYSKKLMMIASDIADLPEETREGLASQLDMTMEAEEDVMADPNLYGDPVTEAEDECSVASVEAALRNPIKASVKSSVSVEDAPLPFVHF